MSCMWNSLLFTELLTEPTRWCCKDRTQSSYLLSLNEITVRRIAAPYYRILPVSFVATIFSCWYLVNLIMVLQPTILPYRNSVLVIASTENVSIWLIGYELWLLKTRDHVFVCLYQRFPSILSLYLTIFHNTLGTDVHLQTSVINNQNGQTLFCCHM